MRVAIIDVHLQRPFHVSVETLHELCAIWQLRILTADTQKPIAKVSFPQNMFHKMFGASPLKGDVVVPDMMKPFIKRMTVMEVIG